MVEEFNITRHAWELLAEAASNGHATELEEFRAANPPPTLKAWLIALRRPDPPEAEVTPLPGSVDPWQRVG